MDIGSLHSLASAAGTPSSQTNGPEADRAQKHAAAQARASHYQAKADQAAGIGQPDGDNHTAEDRYGDGRRPWEFPAAESPTSEQPPANPLPDPTGQSGNLLDLTG